MTKGRLTRETKELSKDETSSDIAARVEQIRTMSQEFIKNRLSNSDKTEQAKERVLNRLLMQIDEVDNPRQLMSMLKQLNEITGEDFKTVVNGGDSKGRGKGGEGGGDTNIFLNGFSGQQQGHEGEQPTGSAGDVPKDVYKMIDIIMQISENISKNSEDQTGRTFDQDEGSDDAN